MNTRVSMQSVPRKGIPTSFVSKIDKRTKVNTVVPSLLGPPRRSWLSK